MTQGQQPYALELAQEYRVTMTASVLHLWAADARDTMRRLHAENITLQQGYDAARLEIDSLQARVQELGAMLRENRSKRIVELEAQLEAIGAGGVEPLRRRECLHQIVEPAPAGEYPALPDPFIGVQDQPWGGHAEVIRSAIGEDGVVSCYTADQMRAYVDADRAMRAQAAPASVAGPSDEDAARARLIAQTAQRFAEDRTHLGQLVYVNDLVWALHILSAAPTTQPAPQLSPTAQAAESHPAPVQSGLVATMLDALRHAQKVLNHNNLHLECGPVNAAILAARAPADSVLEDAVDGPKRWFTVVYRDISPGDEARLLGEHPKASAMSWSHAIRDRDAARKQARSKP